MSVFPAMLLDAYRELNSKKLFWVILAISGIILLFYGSIGFHDAGMSMFYGLMNIESQYLTSGSLMSQVFYRSIFTWFMVGIWLAWAATILALISTTTIFPDFVTGGAVDIVLSKPIERVTLFVLKYLVSLLFVLLQVSVFCLGVFLCLGIRLDDWDWKIFAAIPIVTVFYSYLFSVNVLVGVWTRSAMTALLITFMFWSCLFGINLAQELTNRETIQLRIRMEETNKSVESVESHLADLKDQTGKSAELLRARLLDDIENTRRLRDDLRAGIDRLEKGHRLVRPVQAVLPKTNQTIDLLDRLLKRDTDVSILDILAGNVTRDPSGAFVTTDRRRNREALRRMEAEYDAEPESYVIGSSLVFELVILVIACTVFVRRDY